MSNIFNETLLENLFEEFIEEGFSDKEAEKLAKERFENLATPWG